MDVEPLITPRNTGCEVNIHPGWDFSSSQDDMNIHCHTKEKFRGCVRKPENTEEPDVLHTDSTLNSC